jgi:hypothetical protein
MVFLTLFSCFFCSRVDYLVFICLLHVIVVTVGRVNTFHKWTSFLLSLRFSKHTLSTIIERKHTAQWCLRGFHAFMCRVKSAFNNPRFLKCANIFFLRQTKKEATARKVIRDSFFVWKLFRYFYEFFYYNFCIARKKSGKMCFSAEIHLKVIEI